MAAGQLQGPLASLQNKLPGPRDVLHEIGGHRSAVGAGRIGVLRPGEGLIKMDMGICQPGQNKSKPAGDEAGGRSSQAAIAPLQSDRTQPIGSGHRIM